MLHLKPSIGETTLRNNIELVRIHREPLFRRPEATCPRDILCRFHYYSIKEEMLRRTWMWGAVDFDGASIYFLLDVSSQILYKWPLLKPLLKKIQVSKGTYRWDYPLYMSRK